MRIFSARNPRLEKDESFIQLRGHSSHGCFVGKCLPLEKEWHVVSSYRRGSRTGLGLQSRHSDQIFAQSCNSDRFCRPIATRKISFSSRFSKTSALETLIVVHRNSARNVNLEIVITGPPHMNFFLCKCLFMGLFRCLGGRGIN